MVLRVETAAEMLDACTGLRCPPTPRCCAAAVADWRVDPCRRPEAEEDNRAARRRTLALVSPTRTSSPPLARPRARLRPRLVVGFAAETHERGGSTPPPEAPCAKAATGSSPTTYGAGTGIMAGAPKNQILGSSPPTERRIGRGSPKDRSRTPASPPVSPRPWRDRRASALSRLRERVVVQGDFCTQRRARRCRTPTLSHKATEEVDCRRHGRAGSSAARMAHCPSTRVAMAAAIDLHACLDAPLATEPGTASALIPAGYEMQVAGREHGRPGAAACGHGPSQSARAGQLARAPSTRISRGEHAGHRHGTPAMPRSPVASAIMLHRGRAVVAPGAVRRRPATHPPRRGRAPGHQRARPRRLRQRPVHETAHNAPGVTMPRRRQAKRPMGAGSGASVSPVAGTEYRDVRAPPIPATLGARPAACRTCGISRRSCASSACHHGGGTA